MKLPARLVVGSTVAFVLALAIRVATVSGIAADSLPPTHATSRDLQAAAGPDGDEYLGSRACARCHDVAYEQWERSLHVQMTKPIAEAKVAGDFRDSTRFADHGRSYEFGTDGGKPFVRVAYGGRAPERFSVDYTLGAKRYQGYLSTLPDGRLYVLPVFWHLESRRWVDWKEITPIPDGAHDLRQIWNTNCFNCHATNLVQGFSVETRRYDSTWTEMGLGCEACHGPGRPHVAQMDAWERDPSSKPAYDNSARNRELGAILKTFSPRSAAPRQVFDTCAYCHGNKTNVFVGFRGGRRYEDFAVPFLISTPIPDNDFQGEFWPDGRPNRFNRPQALTLSGCFKAGAVACTNCHLAHGSRNPFSLKVNITQGRNGDQLCTQCHSGSSPAASTAPAIPAAPVSPIASYTGAGLEKHTFHKPESAGSRCITCHMSDVNWRLLIRRRDHTFQPPVPEMTAAFGVPNACTTCHDDRSPEWAARQMDQWWGDGARRKAALSLADTMYRAGSGDAAVLPALARLAVDRSQGVLVRASAVEFMQQLTTGSAISAGVQSQTSFGAGSRPAPAAAPPQPVALTAAQLNALIGAAADPEPTVRAFAVKALAATGQRDRVATPLVARLVDQARVVRAYAAEGLLSLGVAHLPGKAGEALARAQDEYVTSLQMFPDSPANHAERGWLEAERAHLPQAREALETAIRLEPRYARPWVIKGVIAAREAKYDEAIEVWKKARELEPGYPNIDRLIAEAEKLKGK